MNKYKSKKTRKVKFGKRTEFQKERVTKEVYGEDIVQL